jgi:hypothetical protein
VLLLLLLLPLPPLLLLLLLLARAAAFKAPTSSDRWMRRQPLMAAFRKQSHRLVLLGTGPLHPASHCSLPQEGGGGSGKGIWY